MNSTILNSFKDASGLVTVSVFEARASSYQQHWHDFRVDVAPDMVAIGGGGEAAMLPEGALLTASYPDGDLRAWQVSSKDHMKPNHHQLVAYAIGLKIEGMSRDDLVKEIHISRNESAYAELPEASASLPSGYKLISGGFRVNWSGEGNLGTASFPESEFSWKARSKAHMKSSPASLLVWALGIRETLPVGRVVVSIKSHGSEPGLVPSATADVQPGFALTGGGAEVHWRGEGNLLWKLCPVTKTTNQEFTGASKAHMKPDLSSITVYSLGIRIERA